MDSSDDASYKTSKINKNLSKYALRSITVRKAYRNNLDAGSSETSGYTQFKLHNKKRVNDSLSTNEIQSNKRQKDSPLDNDFENSNIHPPFMDCKGQAEESRAQKDSTFIKPTYSYRKHTVSKPKNTYAFDSDDGLLSSSEKDECAAVINTYKKKEKLFNIVPNTDSSAILNSKVSSKKTKSVYSDLSNSIESNSSRKRVKVKRAKRLKKTKFALNLFSDSYKSGNSKNNPNPENVEKLECSPLRSAAEIYEPKTENLFRYELPLNPQLKEKSIGKNIVFTCPEEGGLPLGQSHDFPLLKNDYANERTETITKPSDQTTTLQSLEDTNQEYTHFCKFGELLYDDFVDSCKRNVNALEASTASRIESNFKIHTENLNTISAELHQLKTMVNKASKKLSLEKTNIERTRRLYLKSATEFNKKKNIVLFDNKKQFKFKILKLAKQYVDSKKK